MAKDQPLPLPEGALLAWAANNPDAVRNAFQYLNLLLSLQVKQIRAGVSSLNQQSSLIISEENIILPLPILWGNGVPPDLGGGATLPEVVAKVNLILAGERTVQQPPTGAVY